MKKSSFYKITSWIIVFTMLLSVVFTNWIPSYADESGSSTNFESLTVNSDGTMTFRYQGTGSETSVAVKGSFYKEWAENAMVRDASTDVWSITLPFTPGIQQYGFVVDSSWKDDPANPVGINGIGSGNRIAIMNPVINSDNSVSISYAATGSAITAQVFYKPVDGSSYTPADMVKQDSNTIYTAKIAGLTAGTYEYYISIDGTDIGDNTNPAQLSDGHASFTVPTAAPLTADTFTNQPGGSHVWRVTGTIPGYDNWDPGNTNTVMAHLADDYYAISLLLDAGDYEFQFTKDGGWTGQIGKRNDDGSQSTNNFTFTLTKQTKVNFYINETMMTADNPYAGIRTNISSLESQGIAQYDTTLTQETCPRLVGDLQIPIGEETNWAPATSNLLFVDYYFDNTVYKLTRVIPAGNYSCKIVLGNSWGAINYGVEGDNLSVSLSKDSLVTFTTDITASTKTLSYTTEDVPDDTTVDIGTDPVVDSENKVTFTYENDSAASVSVAGSFTDWENNPKAMEKQADGKWVAEVTLEPGVYTYKLIVDGSNWINDPNNKLYSDGNNVFIVAGLSPQSGLSTQKGQVLALPATGSLYTAGQKTPQTVAVTYSFKDTAITADQAVLSISGGAFSLTVNSGYTGDTIDLNMTATVGEVTYEALTSVSVVEKLYTYKIHYYRADGDYSNYDMWLWEVGGASYNQGFTFNQDAYTDAQGRVWGVGEYKFPSNKMGLIIRSAGSWDYKEAEMQLSILEGSDSADIWVVKGDSTVYTACPLTIKGPRYLVINYDRQDAADWEIYEWTTGDSVVHEFNQQSDGTYKAVIELNSTIDTFSFLIRKDLTLTGGEWVKDKGDRSISVPLGQTVVKAAIKEGEDAVVLPYNIGYEFDNHQIHFYYRDDTLFKEGEAGSLNKVKVNIDGTAYDMVYDAVNERYEYTLTNLTNGHDYQYFYNVTKAEGDTDEKILDAYNLPADVSQGYSVVHYDDLDITMDTEVTADTIDYNQNAVLKVSAAEKDGKSFTIEELYADLSSLGGNAKVTIDKSLMELSIGVNQTVEAGVKKIPVTLVDQYGETFLTEASVTVKARTAAEGDFDWDEAVIYFMVTDRFKDGNTSNNDAYGVGDYNTDETTGSSSYHGGDFAGVTEKLDYLKDLGVNTIWITPIVENILDSQTDSATGIKSYGYHGYWASNFQALNKHLGTEEELNTLISEAHKRNMKIMVDIVINHAGYGTKGTSFPEDMFRTTDVADSAILGSLSGLPDFATEKEAVREKLIEWQTAWVKGYGIDYFRVDTVKHVESTTWADLKNTLTEIDPEFKLIGEYSGAGASNDFGYLNSGLMDSLLNFDFNNMAEDFVSGKLESIEQTLEETNDTLSNTATLGNFLSSHDEDGLYYTLKNKFSATTAEALMKVAASLQMTAKGQPVIYYGEELGLTGANDYPYQTNRYDYDWSIANDSNPMLVHYKKLLSARNTYTDVFAKGTRVKLAGSDTDSYMIFKREYKKESVIIGLNVALEAKTVTLNTGFAANTILKDLYSGTTYTVGSDGTITFSLPSASNGGTVILSVQTSGGDSQPSNTPTPTPGAGTGSSTPTPTPGAGTGSSTPTPTPGAGTGNNTPTPTPSADNNTSSAASKTETTIDTEKGTKTIITTTTSKDSSGNSVEERSETVRNSLTDAIVEQTIVTTVTDKETGAAVTTTIKKDSTGKIISAVTTVTVTAIEIKTENGITRVTIALPDQIIEAAADEYDTTLTVMFDFPVKEVLNALKAEGVTEVAVEIPISSKLANNEKLSMQTILIDKSILGEAREGGKDLQFAVVDENNKVLYSWIFSGDNLDKSNHDLTDVNIYLDISAIAEVSAIAELIKKDNSNTEGLVVDFNHDGILPAPAGVRIYVGDTEGFEASGTAYLYYYNEETGKLDCQPVAKHRIDSDGYITIKIVHCSSYVILPKAASSDIKTSVINQISVDQKLTLQKGKTGLIKVELPSSVEKVSSFKAEVLETLPEVTLGAVITCKSSNKNIVSVNSKTGKITAKKKGTATITVTIKLSNGTKKTYKTKVTVN